MKIAVCVDDNMGMLFNSRRQSRDRELIKDFVETANNNNIYIKPFSKILFEEYKVIIDNNMLNNAQENDFCFLENESILPYIDKVNELIIYRWNRNYPYDFCFEIPENFSLKESTEFKGSSHEKITKEIYIK